MSKSIEKFNHAVDVYLNEITRLGMSENTVKNYARTAKRFRDFWNANSPESEPDAELIRAFRDNLEDEGISKSTIKQYLKELKAFFEFACQEDFGFYEKNPVSKRMFPKITNADDKIYEKILSTADLKLLWKNERPEDYTLEKWQRNYAIITLLLDGKIRNGELLNLKLSDIDFTYGEIEIRKGKGNKRRWVTLSDISLSAIRLYLMSGIRPEYCTDDDYLFGTEAAHAFGNGARQHESWHKGSRQWLSQLVEKHIYAITGKKGFASHSLRHNGAILDLNTGTRMERLQSELGHSSISTTEIYSGRLQSVRRTRDYNSVAEYRDECARENIQKLQACAI